MTVKCPTLVSLGTYNPKFLSFNVFSLNKAWLALFFNVLCFAIFMPSRFYVSRFCISQFCVRGFRFRYFETVEILCFAVLCSRFSTQTGSKDRTSHILFLLRTLNPKFSLLLCCLTFCCDSPIQQIVNVTPLLTFPHVSSLMCCTCFQKEIQNYSKVPFKKVKDSEV